MTHGRFFDIHGAVIADLKIWLFRKLFILPYDRRLAEQVYKQAYRYIHIAGILASLFFLVGAFQEYAYKNPTNILLNILLTAISVLMVLFRGYPFYGHGITPGIYSTIMVFMALLGIETQLHPHSNLPFYDPSLWSGTIIIMMVYAFFYPGPPLTFGWLWFLIMVYYYFRITLETGQPFHRELISTMVLQSSLAVTAFLLNSWWFFIRFRNLYQEQELKLNNERLRELDQIKSDLFSRVTHEFRTPLTMILITVDALVSNRHLPGDVQQAFQSVGRNGKKLLRLVNQLLELSRVESGDEIIHPEKTDLVIMIKLVMQELKEAAHVRNLMLTYIGPEEVESYVDREKVETIFINLLGNALKFSSDGEVMVTLEKRLSVTQIIVKDEGPGIDPELKEKIFQPYDSLGHDTPITGLGLALSRRLARLHGGDLILELPDEGGASFILNIPDRILLDEKIMENHPYYLNRVDLVEGTIASVMALTRAPERVEPIGSGPTILVVEKDPEMYNFLYGILRQDYRFLGVHTGMRALEICERYDVDLVLSTAWLNDMTGIELLKSLREGECYKEVPFVMISSNYSAEDRIKGFELGVDDYIESPFHVSELLMKIHNYASRKKQMQHALEDERRSIYGSIHDLVGSDLTDLVVLLAGIPDNKGMKGDELSRIRTLARRALGELRRGVHEREDMEFLQEQFFSGLKIILHRRYENALREIRFQSSEVAERLLDRVSPGMKNRIYQIAMEICTNDVKYGKGRSLWGFDGNQSHLMFSLVTETTFQQTLQLGSKVSSVEKRLHQIGGSIEESVYGSENEGDKKYCLLIRIPNEE